MLPLTAIPSYCILYIWPFLEVLLDLSLPKLVAMQRRRKNWLVCTYRQTDEFKGDQKTNGRTVGHTDKKTYSHYNIDRFNKNKNIILYKKIGFLWINNIFYIPITTPKWCTHTKFQQTDIQTDKVPFVINVPPTYLFIQNKIKHEHLDNFYLKASLDRFLHYRRFFQAKLILTFYKAFYADPFSIDVSHRF